MLAIETTLDPQRLLRELHAIERDEGRTRTERWGSRTLDLDIVLYDNVTSNDEALRLPHPGLATRDFWQRQLASLRETMARDR